MNLVTMAYGSALQVIWARDSYSITVARATFARAHGIAPAEVVVTVEYANALFDHSPTAAELAIVNAA